VNADESEPGTFKDREIMLRVPHRLIEGCLIVAQAIGSQHVFIYIRGEYLTEFEVLRAALDETRGAGLLGGVTIVLHRGAGAYICGEETALLESLEGKRGQPRSKPPFPAISGLYASPTLINNVETIATVPKVLELGGAEYSKLGAPPNSTGTRVFCLSGNVERPGNYELPHGVTIRELIYDIGGGVPGGRELKAIIPGGSSFPILRADQVDTPLDYDSLAAQGTFLGSGVVIAIDDRCCMVQLGLRVAQFYMHESCGKCTPCREGTRWMVQILERIEAGGAALDELDLLLDVCDRILGKCLCPLGDAAAMPVASYVDKFRAEFREHVERGRCPHEGESTLEHLLAPVDQHTRHPVAEVYA
jgi:NADH-quinone oxidoreductase subunit F